MLYIYYALYLFCMLILLNYILLYLTLKHINTLKNSRLKIPHTRDNQYFRYFCIIWQFSKNFQKSPFYVFLNQKNVLNMLKRLKTYFWNISKKSKKNLIFDQKSKGGPLLLQFFKTFFPSQPTHGYFRIF